MFFIGLFSGAPACQTTYEEKCEDVDDVECTNVTDEICDITQEEKCETVQDRRCSVTYSKSCQVRIINPIVNPTIDFILVTILYCSPTVVRSVAMWWMLSMSSPASQEQRRSAQKSDILSAMS